jgi:hypothetical protein
MARKNSPLPALRPLTRTDEHAFAQVCADARAGLSNALDLILVHNERSVRGPQPRASLNPLTLLLAMAAWERFVTDLALISRGQFTNVGETSAERGGAYLAMHGGAAAKVLDAASGGRVAARLNIRSFDGWRGAAPTSPQDRIGAAIFQDIDAAIGVRNAIAHRTLPRDALNPYWRGDAKSHTVQAGWARGIAAVVFQLVDQAMGHISVSASFDTIYRLPHQWFDAEPARLRGVDEPGPLWGGWSPPRPQIP